jgi:hypothetical protein
VTDTPVTNSGRKGTLVNLFKAAAHETGELRATMPKRVAEAVDA